mmetsp:Transcript_31709/g.48575  ORF Transcript_31709/g.48575 Transcript_31709/m.48575 type:complete len:97 (+) Transcript_31709:2339-2629(+)
MICDKCEDGFRLVDEKNEEDEIQRLCLECPHDGCQTCANNVCKTCITGWFLSGDKCYECNKSGGCEECLGLDVCTRCADVGYVLDDSVKGCECNSK